MKNKGFYAHPLYYDILFGWNRGPEVLLYDSLFQKYNFQGVIHFAAESHVDNSIKNPDAFIRTNVFGTFTLLNTAKNHWMDGPNSIKPKFKDAKFLHVSTDEVYGTLGETGLFTEETPYAPNSPYSASKASSDFMVRSYFHTYGMNVITTNCSNNYGPYHFPEKLIPLFINNIVNNKLLPVYGKGENVRDWLFVYDHCTAIQTVFEKGTLGEVYCVGGDSEKTNLDLCAAVIQILDKTQPRSNGESYATLITHVTDRLGHDFRYAIDATKIKNELGWSAQTSFEEALEITVAHYLNKRNR